MEQFDPSIAPEAATDEPASPPTPQGDSHFSPPTGESRHPPSEKVTVPIPDFDPIPLRYRHDGLTPAKQREYVEALADTGVAREAAARIGVSEQAVSRARRRADARSFNLACEAAVRFAARRVRSIAFERAIEGTIRRHYYHGELKSEERVYDNRLLVYLLGKLDRQLEPPPESEAVADAWEPWMEAIEQGLPTPPEPEPEPESEAFAPPESRDPDDPQRPFDGSEVWESPDGWWTHFPPPADFDGIEEGEPGAYGYKRTLSEAERAVIAAEEAEDLAADIARRDLYFGFEGGSAEGEIFSSRGPETYETSGEDEER
jgi:DNA-binding transcriptional regulator YdaS (Cro superfamily)